MALCRLVFSVSGTSVMTFSLMVSCMHVLHLYSQFKCWFLNPAPSILLGGWLSTAIGGSREALFFSSFRLHTLFSLGFFLAQLVPKQGDMSQVLLCF